MKYLTGLLTGTAIGLAVAVLALRPDAVPPVQCNGPALSELKSGQLRADHAYQFCWDGKDWRLQQIEP